MLDIETFKLSAWQFQQNSDTKVEQTVAVPSKRFPKKTGIENQSNTCYLNSVLQTIFMCDSLREKLLTAEYQLPAELLNAFQQLFAYLKFSQRQSINCDDFGKKVTPSYFSWGRQQDASEFFSYLIDYIMEQEKLISSEKFLTKGFYGNQKCVSRCLTCKNESCCTFQYSELSLAFGDYKSFDKGMSFMGGGKQQSCSNEEQDIKNKSTNFLLLEDMLSNFFAIEELDSESHYDCEKCGAGQKCEKFTALVETPEFLRITLNRFSYTDCAVQKILTEVKIPRTLIVPVHREGLECSDVFCITAIIVHSGYSTNFGHYYCFARHQKISDELNLESISVSMLCPETDFFVDEWYKFDDGEISVTTFDKISSSGSCTPYILVYRKISHDIFSHNLDSVNKLSDLPQHIIASVEKDNENYRKEIEDIKGLRWKYRSVSSSSNSWNNDEDDDSPSEPSNSFNVGPRMVF